MQGGTLEFGKLTMHDADIAMIDISQDEWFQFDLTHYQQQIVNGHTEMTPQAGLRIFMLDIDRVRASKSDKNPEGEGRRRRLRTGWSMVLKENRLNSP